jgi:hypothetical protein
MMELCPRSSVPEAVFGGITMTQRATGGVTLQIDRRNSERTEAKNALGSDRKSCVYPRNVRGFRLVQRTEAGKIQLPNETVQ